MTENSESTLVTPLIDSTNVVSRSLFESFLPRSRSKVIFLFVTYCYALTLIGVTAQLMRLAGLWQVRVDSSNNVPRYVRPGIDDTTLSDLLVVSPIVESLIMIGIIELLRRCRFRVAVQVVASVSVICLVHGFEYTFAAFSIAPGIFILAGSYIYWRRVSFWVGMRMIIALHFLLNGLPAITVIVERLRSPG